MLLLGCAGHWYLSGLYVVPVLGVIAAIKLAGIRDARRDRAEPAGTDAEPAREPVAA